MADTELKFGKHKGSTFEEVRLEEPGYCRWVESLVGCDGQMFEFQCYLSQFRPARGFPRREAAPRKKVIGPNEAEVIHDQEADEEKGEACCVICLVNRRCCITSPCMHLHYCVQCARNLVYGIDGREIKYRGDLKCPGCRKEVKKIVRVHL